MLGRRWWYVLPAVFITYSLAYLDRANYGFGAAAGLAASLRIDGRQSSLLSALFFLGYFIFQVPGVILARKRSATRLVALSLVAWGSLAAMTGVLHSFWMLALVRFLLGVAESFIFPAMLLLITRWFTRQERSRANTILMLANPITVLWMSAITGFLIQSIGWQRTFIIEGIPSILWAFGWIAIIRDRPGQTKWMTPGASAALEAQLDAEQSSIAPIGSVRLALLRRDVLLLIAAYFCWSLGVYGFVLWLPTMVRQGAALSMGRTGLLSAAPYLVAVLLMLLVSRRSDRTLRRVSMIWPFLLSAGLGLFFSFAFAQSSFAFAFAGLVVAGACMYTPYGPFFAVVPELVPRNVAAEVLATINSSGALGGFFGSYAVGWLQAVTGSSRAGYLLMAMSFVCSAALMFFVRDPGRSGRGKVVQAHAH
ncbi:sugar phosphate permease [Granulicella aggregans]|uniref:Sugar phosphate permease n=1 Tax=Granulicella aggregans TaxID=474949 RepID=A0A7W7ZAN2_9BACT|nr:sugar phosphate permease [Granulicella aggregans]